MNADISVDEDCPQQNIAKITQETTHQEHKQKINSF